MGLAKNGYAFLVRGLTQGEQSNECVKPLLLYWDLQHLISIQEKCFFELNLEYEMTPKYLVQLVC